MSDGSVAQKKLPSNDPSSAPAQVGKKLPEESVLKPKKQSKSRETNDMLHVNATPQQVAAEVPVDVSEIPLAIVSEATERRRPSSVSMMNTEICKPLLDEECAAAAKVSTEEISLEDNRKNLSFPSQAHRCYNSMRGNKKIPKITDANPTACKVALKITDNAWAPIRKSGGNVDYKEKILRPLRSVLNKVCSKNYSKLKNSFRDTILENELYMTDIIELIFDEAVQGKHLFLAEYAALCKYVVDVSAQLPPNQQNSVASKFRKSLHVKCQYEFDKKHEEEAARQVDREKSLKEIAKCTDPKNKAALEKQHKDKFVDKLLQQKQKLQDDIKSCTDASKKKALSDELEMLEGNSRRKSVGLIRYVAELFKAQLLTSKIIMQLFISLVEDVHRPDQAEIMCTMFIHIGGDLWLTLNDTERGQIRDCVEKIRKHINIEKESRIKFMLQDTLDLFDNGFVAKHRSQQQAGPTTKQGVLEKMYNEQMEFEKQATKSAVNNNSSRNNKDNFRRKDRGSQGRDNMNSKSSDRWKIVLNSSSRSKRPQNLRTIGNKSSDNAGKNQRLGPGSGFSMWSKGASGGVGGGGGGGGGGGMTEVAGTSKDLRNNTSNSMPSRGNRFAGLPKGDDLPGPETQSRRLMDRGMDLQSIRLNPFKSGYDKVDMCGPPSRGGYQDSNPYTDVDHINSIGRRPTSGSSMSGGDPRNKSLNRDNMTSHHAPPAGAGFYQLRRCSPNPPPRDEPVEDEVDEVGEERMRQLIDTILFEFYESINVEEAVPEINDQVGSRNMRTFVQVALLHCTKKSPKSGDLAGSLVAELFVRKYLTCSVIMEVLQPTLDDFADLSLDIPQLASFVAPLFGNLTLVGAFTLADVWKMVQSTEYQKHKLFLNILKCMSVKKDEETYKMWIASGLKWEIIFKAEEGQRPIDIEEELLRYNLSSLYVKEDASSGDMIEYHFKMLQRSHANVSSDAALRDVVKNLVEPKISHNKVSDMVEDFDGLCDRLEALKRYLELQQPPPADPLQQELSVLYSMQAIAYKLDVPSGLGTVPYLSSSDSHDVSSATVT